MLFPVPSEPSPKRSFKLLLAGGGAAVIAVVVAWWTWPGLSATPSRNFVTSGQPVAGVATPAAAPFTPPPFPSPQTVPATPPQSLPSPPVAPVGARKPASADAAVAALAKPPVAAVARKGGVSSPTERPPEQSAATASNRAEGGTPKGLPPLTISGYINDEQGGRLAIVNDKLVHEGEEVSPGLRLEKIVDDSAVFTYKGQRFRR